MHPHTSLTAHSNCVNCVRTTVISCHCHISSLAMSTRFLAQRMTRLCLVHCYQYHDLLECWNDVSISMTGRSGRNLLSYEFCLGTFCCLGCFEICSDTYTAGHVHELMYLYCRLSVLGLFLIFVSCIFNPLQYCSAFSFLTFSTPAKWFHIFVSCNFVFLIFSVSTYFCVEWDIKLSQ